ncbi:MAG TPA: T9SS type A sorting domain-containing protein [Ignavibacteriaceae bacterium]
MKVLLFVLLFPVLVSAQWTQTQLGDAQIGYNIYSSGTEVFAATLNGVYSTTDLGNPWFNIGLQNQLVFDVITSGKYIIAATEGIGPGVFRSSDHGNNWLNTAGIANQSVRAFAKNSSYVFACTWGGGIFRSSDDGANWQSVGLTNKGFRSIYAAGETIFCGADKIYSSTDNGNTWSDRQLPWPAGDTWGFLFNNGILYACDMGLYASTDMGDTWQLKYGITFDSLGNVADTKIFKDIISYQNKLIASVAFNSIMISYDDGNNWNSFDEGIMTDWTFSGLVIKGSYIWALRDFFGNAYIRPLSDITEVENENIDSANSFILNQNYPNPFNPTTKISYLLSESGNVTLKIYDVLGNEVATLVDEEKPAGEYQVEFDASGFSSGVYYYRLQTESYIETKKMILLK